MLFTQLSVTLCASLSKQRLLGSRVMDRRKGWGGTYNDQEASLRTPYVHNLTLFIPVLHHRVHYTC